MIGYIIIEKKDNMFVFAMFILPFFIVLRTFNVNWNPTGYYQNAIKFSLGKENTVAYQSFFDRNVPRDYEIANYVKANTTAGDSIYIWGNNPQLYKLSEKVPITRYVAAYHSTYFPTGIQETRDAVLKKKPKFIIVEPTNSPFPASLMNYREKIRISDALIYERLY
jgi:hypothetical protein